MRWPARLLSADSSFAVTGYHSSKGSWSHQLSASMFMSCGRQSSSRWLIICSPLCTVFDELNLHYWSKQWTESPSSWFIKSIYQFFIILFFKFKKFKQWQTKHIYNKPATTTPSNKTTLRYWQLWSGVNSLVKASQRGSSDPGDLCHRAIPSVSYSFSDETMTFNHQNSLSSEYWWKKRRKMMSICVS